MIRTLNRSIERLSAWVVVVVMMAVCSPVWAQAEGLTPPRTKNAPSSPKYLIMGLVLLLVGATVVAVTLKSKRGHQD